MGIAMPTADTVTATAYSYKFHLRWEIQRATDTQKLYFIDSCYVMKQKCRDTTEVKHCYWQC